MTAAEVTSITINKHSQVQGTAEVSYWNYNNTLLQLSYWNSFLLAKVLHNVFINSQLCLSSIIILELCSCTN